MTDQPNVKHHTLARISTGESRAWVSHVGKAWPGSWPRRCSAGSRTQDGQPGCDGVCSACACCSHRMHRSPAARLQSSQQNCSIIQLSVTRHKPRKKMKSNIKRTESRLYYTGYLKLFTDNRKMSLLHDTGTRRGFFYLTVLCVWEKLCLMRRWSFMEASFLKSLWQSWQAELLVSPCWFLPEPDLSLY